MTKRVMMITTSFPDKIAFQAGQEAAGSFVADFALALAQQTPTSIVAASSEDGIEQVEELKIYRFAVPKLPLSLLKPTNPAQWGNIFKSLQAGQNAVKQAVAEWQPDHLFALWALPSGYWARQVGKERRIPYSIWALGSDIWGLGKVPVIRFILKKVLQGSQHCFADGYKLAEDVTKIAGIPCQFLPSSRRLTPTNNRPKNNAPPYRLAFLGRWHPNKGADLLLDALNLLTDADWEKIEQVRYCGGGPLEKQVKQGIAQLQKNGRSVQLEGFLDKTEATALYEWADYLLLPSRIESIPVIFSDAMQCGTPIISTPVGDLPRLLELYDAGILAPKTTATAFTKTIQKTITLSPHKFHTGIQQAAYDFCLDQTTREILKKL